MVIGIGLGWSIARGQAPEGWQQRERTKLLEGISSVPKPGTPGPVAIWGTLAFPVLAAKDGGEAELAVMAAAGHGKGRVVISGHTGFLASGGVTGDLLANMVRWAGGRDQTRVGASSAEVATFLSTKGFQATKVTFPADRKMLDTIDVLVVQATTVASESEAAEILEFVKRGGGLVTSMTGWAHEQVMGGKPLHTSPLNRALLPLGIAFTEAAGWSGQGTTSFQARVELPEMLNAGIAVTSIRKQKEGGAPLTQEQAGQGASAIQLTLAAQPPGRNQLATAVIHALGEGSAVIPTKQQPLTQAQHVTERIRLGIETRVLKLTAAIETKAHAAAATFPGVMPPGVKPVVRELSVNPGNIGWISTGLYANAGETITVKVPQDQVGKGLAIRIGCHKDTLYHLDSWRRAPDITLTMPIEAVETRVASAFGGLVYIVVPERGATGAAFLTSIAGGYEAPYFVLGKHTDEDWNTRAKTLQAPWAELAGEKMVLSVPTEVARMVRNPTELMQFWDRVVTDQDDLTNQGADRKGPERMVADVQISAGFMHSGYPIMIHTPEALEMVTYGRIKFPGWGFYHEIGHNHQRKTFTFEGCGEVTNNMIGLYNYAHTLGRQDFTMGHGAITLEKRKEYIDTIRKAPDKWAVWRSNPFLALTIYIQLIESFGWEPMKGYLHSFGTGSTFGPDPKTDEEARDQFLIRYSKLTKKNLAPLFAAWGIPTTEKARAEVAPLETWMPKEM